MPLDGYFKYTCIAIIVAQQQHILIVRRNVKALDLTVVIENNLLAFVIGLTMLTPEEDCKNQ